jgi:hypothetical protein
MRRFLYVATLAAALSPGVETHAAMGLKCSQWLDVRAYLRYDAQTKKFVDERPQTMPPVSEDVDTKMAWASWYMSGHAVARFLLDRYLAKAGAAVDVTITPANPADETRRELTAIDNLCRNGLQTERQDYDIAEIIDLRAAAVLAQRAIDITTMLEHAMEAGRRSR